ncbi:hypothetical protein [Kaistella sp.]|uniref:hypothetical protein n=1 Tax=Kaistella sp. TaxID=2782235 RepID=UPI003C3E7852
MSWSILIIFGVFAIALLVFLIIRNQKDEKEFEKELNDDYPKPMKEDNDIEKMN